MQYEEDIPESFIDDMKAFEAKYPNTHLVIEVNDETNGQYRVEHGEMELYFEKYKDIIKYLKIYD